MNAGRFIREQSPKWERLEALLAELRKGSSFSDQEFQQLNRLYRIATSDFAYAKTFFPDHEITAFLNKLVAESHGMIYRRKKFRFSTIFDFLLCDAPATFVRYRKYMLISLLIFFGSGILGFSGSEFIQDGERIFLNFSLLNPEGSYLSNQYYIERTEENIARGKPFAVYEEDEKAIMSSSIMFNNIRVAIMAFAGGIFAGVVTAYMMFFTGMMVGAFFHIFYRHGIIFDFWNTVMLHGMLELSMIVVAGGAGLMIGKALVFPGKYRFRDLAVIHARDAGKIAVIFSLFLVIAGTIEGTLTGANLNTMVKILINIWSIMLMTGYFAVMGSKAYGRMYPAFSSGKKWLISAMLFTGTLPFGWIFVRNSALKGNNY